MTRQRIGVSDGLTEADRNTMLYEYFWAASEVGGHLPPVRGFGRIFFRRRTLQVFTSNRDAAHATALIDPKFVARVRRRPFWPGPRRRDRD
jgi:hypothetical protein